MPDEANATGPPNALSALLSSGTKADLLVLFHRNPGLIDTADGIARRLGKKGSAITKDVSELASASILQKKVVGRSEVYFLNREKDREAQKNIAEYITNLGEKRQS
ncbi:MAG: ArsR family transcriptional regulator [Thaumarchaeota archaeon]|nr:ArsR family transcriptional regulator [Nitrososphaerota archaeon]